MAKLSEDLLWQHDAGLRTFGIDSAGVLHEIVGVGVLSRERPVVTLSDATTARIWFWDKSLELELDFPDDMYLHFRFVVPDGDIQESSGTQHALVSQLAGVLRSFIEDVRTPRDSDFLETDDYLGESSDGSGSDEELGIDAGPVEDQPARPISAGDVEHSSFRTVEGGYQERQVDVFLGKVADTLRSYELDQPTDCISSEEVRSVTFVSASGGYVWEEVDRLLEEVAGTLALYEQSDSDEAVAVARKHSPRRGDAVDRSSPAESSEELTEQVKRWQQRGDKGSGPTSK